MNMRIFLQDYYLRGLAWISFKEGLKNGGLNLSLYFNKYINKSSLIDSPNTAKLFSVNLLNNFESIEKSLVSLVNDLDELKGIICKYSEDDRKEEVLEKLNAIRELVTNGALFEIDTTPIKEAEKLFYKDYNKIKLNLLKIIKSIARKLEEIKKFNSFEVRLKDLNCVLEQYKLFYELQKEMWSKIKAETFKMKTKSRLVVGLGDESVYETSIRLHRNYGIPYIPGSALKGVAKHYAILNLADELIDQFDGDFFVLAKRIQEALENPARDENSDTEVRKAIEEKLKMNVSDELFEKMMILRRIFGTQKREGDVIFFDAFPIPDQFKHKPILELDIMNPHYQPYYQQGEQPGDWHQPNPIFFLTVPEDIEFQFALASRKDESNVDSKKDKSELEKAVEMLKEALEEFGVGAKTSLGYGRFG